MTGFYMKANTGRKCFTLLVPRLSGISIAFNFWINFVDTPILYTWKKKWRKKRENGTKKKIDHIFSWIQKMDRISSSFICGDFSRRMDFVKRKRTMLNGCNNKMNCFFFSKIANQPPYNHAHQGNASLWGR